MALENIIPGMPVERILREFQGAIKALEDGGGGNVYKTYTALLNQTTTVIPSSTLVLEVGKTYCIFVLEDGDDFSNVGYTSKGVPFVATGATPNVWNIKSDTLVVDMDDSQPSVTILEDNVSLTDVYLTSIFMENEDAAGGIGGIGDAGGGGAYNLFIIFEKEGEFLRNKTFIPNNNLTRLNDDQLLINIGVPRIIFGNAEYGGRRSIDNYPIEFRIYN